MKFSTLVQFFLGFILGITVLGAGAAGIAYLFFLPLSGTPSKPTFSEEKPKPTPVSEKTKTKPSPKAQVVSEKPSPKPSPEAQEKEKEEEKEKLPSGAYKARVTWGQGLRLRSEPNSESNPVGGVDYNQNLVILTTSPDGRWQKVRTESGQEGWIKAGNTEKTNEL